MNVNNKEFYLLRYNDVYSAENQPTFRRMVFNGLYGVTSQKIKLFLTTAVRTSNLTNLIIHTNFVVMLYCMFVI
jgi:hypothetical protein